MMLINLEDLLPRIRHLLPSLEEAQKVVDNEADSKARGELIDSYRSRWVALRPFMAELSNDKCWYTESKNPGTDDDVDHFRPKKRVDLDPGEAPHPGYYWLAFQWWNLRLSCHRTNRLRRSTETGFTGGKGDRFPLVDPAKRARTPTADRNELDKEEPLLLDPTKPRDVALITFNADGTVQINPGRAGIAVDVRRFEASRDCYNLDWPDFKDRRVEIYNEVERTVNRGMASAPSEYDSTTRPAGELENVIRDLLRLMSRESDFSAAATAFVRSYRDVWWVRDIVLVI